jgi:putative FmdB family regulatory protein
MPTYPYKCSSCGPALDVLRKVSDAPLTSCPNCQAETFAKQLTAAGFQLKGSGWYATDFKNGSKAGRATADATGADAKGTETKGTETKETETKGTETKGTDSPSPAKSEKSSGAASASGSCGHGGCSACS